MKKTGFVSHVDFERHLTGQGHPECPERLRFLLSYLQNSEVYSHLKNIAPGPGDVNWIEKVHPRDYVDLVQNACKSETQYIDSDTVVCGESYRVALLAVGAAVTACQAVMAGEIDNAFCAVRPPGHHAEPRRAMGFCLFNNVAIAAKYLLARTDVERVCIIDWDVHHGNGTQAAFYADPNVLYVSTHQHPLYPGTGSRKECGMGSGLGYTLNLPLAAGADDSRYAEVFQNDISPAVTRFAPDFILISAGFDAHVRDPVANMSVTERGFAQMTRTVVELAESNCSGRLVSVLEGGYDLKVFAASVEAHLEELLRG